MDVVNEIGRRYDLPASVMLDAGVVQQDKFEYIGRDGASEEATHFLIRVPYFSALPYRTFDDLEASAGPGRDGACRRTP